MTVDEQAALLADAYGRGVVWEQYAGELSIRPNGRPTETLELHGESEFHLAIAYAQRIRRLTTVLREIAYPAALPMLPAATSQLLAQDALESSPEAP